MKYTGSFTFSHLLLIILIFASAISCNQADDNDDDEIIVENQNVIGRWKSIEQSDSIDHIVRQLIFESDSTYIYEISEFISIPPPENFPGPLYVLISAKNYIGHYFIDGRNLSLQPDTQINTDFIFEDSDTLKINSFIFEECKFEIVDTFLTLRYTTYRANTPLTNSILFQKIDGQELVTTLNAH